ncbi:MAG TPA: transposase [Thermoplasmata archaeon]|nr:transposase [Thermoplasmata archaeon]
MPQVVRALVLPIQLPASLIQLMKEFRLIVNKSIRFALAHDARSRGGLARVAYRGLSAEHDIYKQYIPAAFEVALAALKLHRRSLRFGRPSTPPHLRRLLVKAENQTYRLDRTTGRLTVPIRAGERIAIDLPLSAWHRSHLDDPLWGLGSLTIVPGRVVVVLRRPAPVPYQPGAAIALDTNEVSLDGVFAEGKDAVLASVQFPAVRIVQSTHFRRRRRLAKKKAHDRRVKRHLLAREGRRERNRVKQRLHLVSKGLVRAAADRSAAIVLEDLRMPQGGGRSRRTNRRLSSWPQGELHRQIEYKALAAGVPLVKINPKYTSKTCPRCDAVKERRERVGRTFECGACGWSMDRQHNAGLNILKTALALDCVLARAVRFQPAALRKDAMSPLYDLPPMVTGAREESSGVEVSPGPGDAVLMGGAPCSR